MKLPRGRCGQGAEGVGRGEAAYLENSFWWRPRFLKRGYLDIVERVGRSWTHLGLCKR